MGPGMFDGLGALIYAMAAILLFTVPLAGWKLLEILMWLVSHVHIS